MQSFQCNKGFTIIELLAVISIIGVLASIFFPQISSIKSQMAASQDIRTLASTLSQLRAEAVRTRSPVRVSFSTHGLSWDIFDNSSTDGSWTMQQKSNWSGQAPGPIVFNGLGLIRGISGEQSISISNGGYKLTLIINQNGHVSL